MPSDGLIVRDKPQKQSASASAGSTALASRLPRVGFVLLVPILIVATAVRILGLGNTDLWGDEAFSVMTSLGPPSKLLGILATSEPHPPLYPFMLAAWLRLFGSSEFVARLPSAFAGIASVAVAASLARSFAPSANRRVTMLTAAIAGLLVALNPFQVWYSQEARMYAQVSFFAGLATLALHRLWHGRRGAVPLYALAIVGAAGSHYYGLFVALGHALAMLILAARDRQALLRWARAVVLASILYLPWVYLALRVFTSYYGGPPGSEDLVQVATSSWARVVAGWSLSWNDAVRFASVLSVFAVVGMLLPSRSEDDRFSRVVLVFWLFTPFVGGYLVSLIRPLYNERYLIVCSLPFILFVTRSICWTLSPFARSGRLVLGATNQPASTMDEGPAAENSAIVSTPSGLRREPLHIALGASSVVIAAGALVATLAMAYLPLHNVWIGEYLKSAYNTHVKTVDLLARAGDAVILNGSSQEQLYRYYAREPLPFYTLPRQTPLDPAATSAELEQIAREHSGGWVFWYATPNYDPRNVIGDWLSTHAYLSLDVYVANARLQYYRFAPDASLAVRKTNLEFGDSLNLAQYGWTDVAVPAGSTVPVDLAWRRLTGATDTPRVALRLVDASGFTWAQTDQSVGDDLLKKTGWPTNGLLDDRHGIMIPTGTPPGDYQLLLNVYNDQHPNSFPVTGSGASISPGGVILATIHVDAPSRVVWTAGIAGFQPKERTFESGLALLGYAGSEQVKAGESGYLTIVWKALVPAPAPSRLRLQLLAADGTVAEQRDLPLATNAYPTSRWQSGAVLREQYRLPVDGKLAAGDYRIAILPISNNSSSGDPVILGNLRIEAGPRPISVAPPQHPLDYSLDGKIALRGFDLVSTQARPGETLALALHWSDLAPVDGDYTVFVHVLDSRQKVVAQHDQPPAAGQRPTSSWFPGDLILDSYQIVLPASLPPGDYAVEVGMYNPTNGARLPVARGGQAVGDRIILTSLHVAS